MKQQVYLPMKLRAYIQLEVSTCLPVKQTPLLDNEAADSNFDGCKISDGTPTQQQPAQVLNSEGESTRICEGNSVEIFLPLVEKHKGVFKNVSGQP